MEKGLAILFERPQKVAIRTITYPAIDEQTIVIKTTRSGISLGTEMALYTGIGIAEAHAFYPLVPGYEGVGEVIFVGKNAQRQVNGEPFKPGDRVMANEVRCFPDVCGAWGGHTEYIIKNPLTAPAPMDECVRIPDNVSYEQAVVAYLGAVALKGIDMVGIHPGESVLVIGAGNVGLSAMQLSKIFGAGNIICGDITPARLKWAEKFADHRLDMRAPDIAEQIKHVNNGRLVDVVIECSGDPNAVNPIADYVRPGGRVHLQGQYRAPVVLTTYSRWNCSDLRISCSIATEAGCKARILDLISKGKFSADLYDNIVPYTDAVAAYSAIQNNRYGILKTIFNWEDVR